MTKNPPYALPEALEHIKTEALKFQEFGAPDYSAWRETVDQSGLKLLPEIRIEDDGEILYLHQISPGCQVCKTGGWDCIFINHTCNLNCPFCYSPRAISPGYSGSVFGKTVEEVLDTYTKTNITGVSFTGGEPFLDECSLLKWVSAIRASSPSRYLWVYTNGLLVTEELLRQLADAGLDEIRFNMAATGYRHRQVLATLETAAQLVPHVTVEIPSIPGQADDLLGSLKIWSDCGVAFLNLHELIFEPGTNSATMDGERQSLTTPDHHLTSYHPQSRRLTWEVIKKVSRERINLAVNDCSLQGKLRQLRKRRKILIPLVKTPYEQEIGDDILKTNCVLTASGEIIFLVPGGINPNLNFSSTDRYFTYSRIVPLSLNSRSQWITFEELSAGK